MLFELKSVFQNEGEEKSLCYELDFSKVDVDGVFPFKTPVSVSAAAKNRAGLISVRLDVSFDYVRNCDRCTEEFSRRMNMSFTHNLVQTLADDGNDDYIETPDFVLELDDVVTADILLSLPSKNLCRSDCKGLCPGCGRNLNYDSCVCTAEHSDPRLEVLKQLIN